MIVSDIVLATINAKYIHASLALRSLFANLAELQSRAEILEFDLKQRPVEMAEAVLERRPKVVAFGVYIWNVAETARLLSIVKKNSPETIVVLGGPEVSYAPESHPVAVASDYVIAGEGEAAFLQLCRQILVGGDGTALPRIIYATPPDLASVEMPFRFYSDHDIRHRVIYVEASRGCPFTCEFCLSSLDGSVRRFDLSRLFQEWERLLDRGALQFKFLDRTFNLDAADCGAILDFFIKQSRPGLFLHFEIMPERLSQEFMEKLAALPREISVQFEVGVQSFCADALDAVRRRRDDAALEFAMLFLREKTRVHIHADLIAGLPYETLESFADGFDRLISWRPHEIQVGLLKRLRGAPIARHDSGGRMVYDDYPPYEILANRWMDFSTIRNMSRFSRYWDMVGNSGHFVETLPLLWEGRSPFHAFWQFSGWLFSQCGQTSGINPHRLAGFLFKYLVGHAGVDTVRAAECMRVDYFRSGKKERLDFISGEHVPSVGCGNSRSKRQRRHGGVA